MKQDVPQEFLKKYESRRKDFQAAIEEITRIIKLRLSQLAAQKGTRARFGGERVKRPGKIWRNASKAGLSGTEALEQVEDILGIRIVCNNLSDIGPIIEMIQHETGMLEIIDIKDMIKKPTKSGYRATHIQTKYHHFTPWRRITVPCEIQIRTLAQDAWARISRADLYAKQVPETMWKLTRTLSRQLSAMDHMAQLLRDELDRTPATSGDVKGSDYVTPPRLALLFKQKYGEELYEWSLHDWYLNLKEAEVELIEEVRALLDDSHLQKILNRISKKVRGSSLEDSEWATYSALFASEVNRTAGFRAVKDRIQEEWDEIVTVAESQESHEMPETIEDFVQDFREDSLPVEGCLSGLGCFHGCKRCGNETFKGTEFAVSAVLEHYGQDDDEWDLEHLIDVWRFEEGYPEDGVYCDYCAYQVEKDD